MCEQHLDLLTFTSRRYVGLGLGDGARNVSGVLVDPWARTKFVSAVLRGFLLLLARPS
jgi:hypothetical protein